MKRLLRIIFLICLTSCTNQNKDNLRVRDYIPSTSEVILITPDLKQLIEEIDDNQFISQSDFPLKKKLSTKLAHLQFLNFKKETALAFSNLASANPIYTLITAKDTGFIALEQVKDKIVETINEGDLKFKRISLNENKFFLLETSSIAILSNSKQKILEFNDQDKRLKSESFQKAFDASDASKTSVFINHEKIPEGVQKTLRNLKYPAFKEVAEWSVIDLDIAKTAIRINGISIFDSNNDITEKFSALKPQPSETGKICPTDFISFYSISSDNFKEIYENHNYEEDSLSLDYPDILNHTREIASISLKTGEVIVLNINEIEAAKETLAGLGEQTDIYRGASLIKFEKSPGFSGMFRDLILLDDVHYYTIQDHFVILGSDLEQLKDVITAFQNSDVLANKAYFNELMNSLASEASSLLVVNPVNSTQQHDPDTEGLKLNFQKNCLVAFQMINEDNFAHLHGIFTNSKETVSTNGAQQSLSIKLDAPVTSNPYFFKNHRTDQMDLAVQDENNDLYLISNKGNVFWKKNMDSQITSPVFQVDLFKNGNQQLAFSTGYNLEVIDRTGKKVKGFPIKFNQPLTQPLAVFDYDNNRTYRFVLTQNKKVYMVGPKGKAIKGFDFENASSPVIKSPKHIRLGNKDYILIAEESGRLNILSRQGKIRVPITENIEFSDNEWYGYQNSFVSTQPAKNMVRISQNGTVSRKDLKLAENNRIVANRNDLVYLSENELNINSNSVALEFGLYTDPQLFQFRNRTIVAVTDTQTQKVFVYNEKAELLEGFPVYGTSQVDIANADLDSKLELAVRGEENEILIYEFP